MPVVIDFGPYLRWTMGLGLAALGLLFVAVFAARLVEMARARRRRALERAYRPIIDALADPSASLAARAVLARAPQWHADTIGRLLLSALRLTSGEFVEALRDGARAAGLDRRWRRATDSRHWWERADAAAALGLLRDPAGTPILLALLDDRHEQVRAAAVTALGWLADRAAIGPLITRLADETKHQRVRVIEALQHFGLEVGPPLLAYAAERPDLVPLTVDLIGQLRLTAAVDRLIDWTGHADPVVRAAALRALGTIGLDDRAFYYAVRALGDDAPEVRAMAARSLGKGGRVDASSYLEGCLDDDWLVAAEAAKALRRLGAEGRSALERARARGGPAGDLARQVLWSGAAAIEGPGA